MSVKSALVRLHWFCGAQLGLDVRRLVRVVPGAFRYCRDLRRFRSQYHGRLELLPCLHDWHEEGGTTASEYFWQDLIVARRVFAAAPIRHVDIGSRVDGFVSHVASFRDIEVIDVRPISTQVPGIRFVQADLMTAHDELEGYCDSLSCLHALEHFGLGRYGDPVDPDGSERGIENMSRMLRADGTLYLSVPVGVPRVEFNAHRVFDPQLIVELASRHSLDVVSLTVVRAGVAIDEGAADTLRLANLAKERYALGVFVFRKRAGE